ncbi:MAG TPA: hypothetical protein VF204_11915, partial [Streptosporangiaceae bacterium]
LCWWLTSVAVFGAAVAIFDDLINGGPLSTGYRFVAGPDQVTFGPGAIVRCWSRPPAMVTSPSAT